MEAPKQEEQNQNAKESPKSTMETAEERQSDLETFGEEAQGNANTVNAEKGKYMTTANNEELSESGVVATSEAKEDSHKTEEGDGVPPIKRTKKSEQFEKQTDAGSHGESKAETEKQELRTFQRIPIFIVDYHNDVLEFIYRCLATRHLPMENNILVHFDSHPDMVISREIPASASFDKETMLAELSIENWIMPACYAGHFNRVIWLKNSWCQQMPLGKYNFKVGHKGDKISVDCPLDYFISEGNYCATNELQEPRDMQLLVYNTDATVEKSLDPTEFLSKVDAKNFVLDIDLDFFSTSNPFLEIYKDANCYEQLTHIFHFESSAKDCGGTTERRKQQLEALKRIFEHLEEVRTFEGLSPPDAAIISAETYVQIENLAASLQKHYADDEIDWLLIYDSGSTTDTNGLPHHISTPKELEQYFGHFKQFLQRLPVPPVIITMACSAEDDYCPKAQVSHIQEQVLHILREVFGAQLHERPILHYLDEEWDVMQL